MSVVIFLLLHSAPGGVPSGTGESAIKPFLLAVDDQALSARINDAIYRVPGVGQVVNFGASEYAMPAARFIPA